MEERKKRAIKPYWFRAASETRQTHCGLATEWGGEEHFRVKAKKYKLLGQPKVLGKAWLETDRKKIR